MSLSFQLFVGLPVEALNAPVERPEGFGLEMETAGADISGEMTDSEGKKFIGLSLGLPVLWDGEWAQSVTLKEFEEAVRKVKDGFQRAGIQKDPELYFLVNFY